MKENGEPMFTLTGQDIHGIATENRIRRLTPKECERLQAFPDDWTMIGFDKKKKTKEDENGYFDTEAIYAFGKHEHDCDCEKDCDITEDKIKISDRKIRLNKSGQFVVSDTQRYKMMGNAVTVNVIEAIGKRMLEVM